MERGGPWFVSHWLLSALLSATLAKTKIILSKITFCSTYVFDVQLISKDAHVLGCGKSMVNGEPYYVAQMDSAENMDNEKRETMEKPEKVRITWCSKSYTLLYISCMTN